MWRLLLINDDVFHGFLQLFIVVMCKIVSFINLNCGSGKYSVDLKYFSMILSDNTFFLNQHMHQCKAYRVYFPGV